MSERTKSAKDQLAEILGQVEALKALAATELQAEREAYASLLGEVVAGFCAENPVPDPNLTVTVRFGANGAPTLTLGSGPVGIARTGQQGGGGLSSPVEFEGQTYPSKGALYEALVASGMKVSEIVKKVPWSVTGSTVSALIKGRRLRAEAAAQ